MNKHTKGILSVVLALALLGALASGLRLNSEVSAHLASSTAQVVLAAPRAIGDLVATVNFSVACTGPAGQGLGIAFDGRDLWYTCDEGHDLHRASATTGIVDRSYDIDLAGGLTAISYDAKRDVLWTGWQFSNGNISTIQLVNDPLPPYGKKWDGQPPQIRFST